MSARRYPLVRFQSLRRSVWLAMFAMAIMLLRVGMVVACAPSDLVESVHATEHALLADSSHSDDGDSQHPCGDCLHSGCHLPMTLPAVTEHTTVVLSATLADRRPLSRADAPPGLSLRPPII
jgi:hypothetical protein